MPNVLTVYRKLPYTLIVLSYSLWAQGLQEWSIHVYDIVKRLVVVATSVAAFIIMTLALATQANAYVGNCALGYSSAGAYASCSQGNSASYRVGVWCQNKFTLSSRAAHGPWVPRGGQTPSVVSGCEWYEHFYGTPWAEGS